MFRVSEGYIDSEGDGSRNADRERITGLRVAHLPLWSYEQQVAAGERSAGAFDSDFADEAVQIVRN